jgi:hypothetical protein
VTAGPEHFATIADRLFVRLREMTMSTTDIKSIQTRYAGCHFRSRLEARWAVFFDHAGISWEYEPQGYVIEPYASHNTDAGANISGPYGPTPYLPDFLLPDCGTWIEVKGDSRGIDLPLMEAACRQLPDRAGAGPRLMILGPIPEPTIVGDWAWHAFSPCSGPCCEREPSVHCNLCDGSGVDHSNWGFGRFHKNRRPWWLSSSGPDWVTPALDMDETCDDVVLAAYRAARSARFEHGETPRTHS